MSDNQEVMQALSQVGQDLNLVLVGQYPMGLGSAQRHLATEQAFSKLAAFVRQALDCDCANKEPADGDS